MVVSVIIPTYNRCNLIGLTIESFIRQNFDKNNFEIIIADNNSTDDTKNVVTKIAEGNTHISIKYFLESRQGVHYARNSAAKIAKGSFLYFTDDDMIADPDLLKELLYLFTLDEKIACVTGSVLPKWEVEPPEWIRKYCQNGLLSLNIPEEKIIISDDDCNVYSCHEMIKRDLFFKSGGFNPENTKGEWIGDGETGLNMKLKELKCKFASNSKSTIYHIIPVDRMSQKYLNKRLANQGNSDCYTYYRKFRPSSKRLTFDILIYVVKSFYSFIKYIYKKITGADRWHIHFAYCYYYFAKIKYSFRLIFNADWRTLVLKMNWIDE